jgi:microcystin-dependent protein
LFSVIGTRFGGDGQTTFQLPNLTGSAPMHQGTGLGLTTRNVGETVGSETVTLDTSNMPAHTHGAIGVENKGTLNTPANHMWAEYISQGSHGHTTPVNLYSATPDLQMSPMALTPAGGYQPHNNMQPYLAMNFIICLEGLYPAKS